MSRFSFHKASGFTATHNGTEKKAKLVQHVYRTIIITIIINNNNNNMYSD